MEVNYHTLADFRVEEQAELDELFTQVLAARRPVRDASNKSGWRTRSKS